MESFGNSRTVDVAIPPKPEMAFDTPLPAAPSKNHKRRLIKAIAIATTAVVGVGIGLGISASKQAEPKAQPAFVQPGTGGNLEPGGAPNGTAEVPDPVEPVVPTVGEVAGEAAALLKTVSPELHAGLQSFKAYDVNGAARHLDNVGDIYDQVAALWLPVDGDMASYVGRAGDEMHKAADSLRNYRINASTEHMNTATTYIKLSTAHAKSLTAEITG